MATEPPSDLKPAGRGLVASVRQFLRGRGAVELPPSPQDLALRRGSGVGAGVFEEHIADPVTITPLAGTQQRPVRSRQQVYEKWQDMCADPIIASALTLHVTGALGGHESRGQMVFIEVHPDFKGNKEAEALVAEVKDDLELMFNRVAPTLAFLGVWFGDGYGRLYATPRVGLRDIYVDELVLPPLVQPYERGSTTIGYTVATGSRYNEKLSVLQMMRMKMPRLMYVPQSRVIEKAIRVALTTDELEDLPALPAVAGGSFLDGAEAAYDKFSASWAGLTGQRVADSIDETLLSVTQTGMTPQQRDKFQKSLKEMFDRSNGYREAMVNAGRYAVGRIFHLLPTSSDKQIVQIQGAPSQGRAATLTIDDVMMNAKLLSGALGMDLSMQGFADLLSGGLGEGGFFRVSAQSAERARRIRGALSDALDHAADVHVLMKKNVDLNGQRRPWVINFFSGISALETEHAKTKGDKINATALFVQTLEGLKNLGLSKETMQTLLEQEAGMDAEAAKKYAADIEKAAKAAKAEAAGQFGDGPGGGPLMPGAEPGTPGGGIEPAEG
jgi:hypothetical protein